jgi:hypothetical protein
MILLQVRTMILVINFLFIMIKELTFTKVAPDLATPQSIKALEAKLGFQFPPAFVEFCHRWNGGFPDDNNKFYPVPSSFGAFYEEYKQGKGVYAHRLLGATEIFWQCSLRKESALLVDFCVLGEVSHSIIPITVDLFGDRVVLRSDSPTGLVYWWDHILWDAPGQPYLIPIAPDLEFFYNSLTSDPYRK